MSEVQQLNMKSDAFQALFTADGLQQLDVQFLTFLQARDAHLHQALLAYRQSKSYEYQQGNESLMLIDLAVVVQQFVVALFDIEKESQRQCDQVLKQDPIFAFKKEFVLKRAKRKLNAEIATDFDVLNDWLDQSVRNAGSRIEYGMTGGEYGMSERAASYPDADRGIHGSRVKHGMTGAGDRTTGAGDRTTGAEDGMTGAGDRTTGAEDGMTGGEHGRVASDRELAVACFAMKCLGGDDTAAVEKLTHWCVLALRDEVAKSQVKGWVSFHLPAKLDYANLVTVEPLPNDPFARFQGPVSQQRQRDGFTLTDARMQLREVLDEIHYCVYCHKNDGDFCSQGFPVKRNQPDLGLKMSPTGEVLAGCPLEEKISEMQVLKKVGQGIAALVMIMRDNPMCAATGHRICNDCMKGCIYQKQQPVDIPQVETRVLTDVLELPWGVEIYDLLTRWNPLRQDQYCMQAYNGKKVLVMGMGPAGFTLAHHLTMAGCAVVGADGLKIEPLDPELLCKPIRYFADLKESLDDRVMAGFGGVAEYGITVRWDKNFLKLIYICLMRRPYFQVFGGVRFGGTLTVEDAWAQGFDHVSLAVGAGLPKELPIKNSLAPGMRQANDFLMALQLTGAAKKSSIANLQIRLPAIVIGGGLTGVDAATEMQAYYIKQVEKVAERYQILLRYYSESAVRERFQAVDLIILDEFLVHADAVAEERRKARQQKRAPDFISLLRQWGGVSIVYRRSMQESPAYRRNHEELQKALEEGIYYAEGLEPKQVELDEQGYCKALTCRWRIQDAEGKWMYTDEHQTLPARTILVATGAKPNVAYGFEHAGTFERRRYEYLRYSLQDGSMVEVSETGHVKMPEFGALTSYNQDERRVSFLGDTHPIFHGSVVKAIASAKRSYPAVLEAITDAVNTDVEDYQEFHNNIEAALTACVVSVVERAPDVVELTLRAPLAAARFMPGQFYRVQNFETDASLVAGTRLQTEALALLGFKRQGGTDLLSFLVVTKSGSASLVADFKENQKLSLMGPTGVATKIPETPETILIVGGQYAIVYLMSVAPALRAAGCRVIFVGGFTENTPAFCLDDVARLADEVILGKDVVSELSVVDLQSVQQVHVIGDADLLRSMREVQGRCDAKFIASVYGPMQCMMKGVCAQCLQWQVDPKTGERTKAVYACSWQHQPLQLIDVGNIDDRLAQNRMQETLTNLWLEYIRTQ